MSRSEVFDVLATCPGTAARLGRLRTAHGTFDTPAFMPVGTHGTVKALSPNELSAHGAGCILANAYHLALRPGADVVQRMGRLHAFMGWQGPILTDSGGFQVMSLGGIREVLEHGVLFTSYLDGSHQLFSPERAMSVQAQLGSDIAMVLDECVAYPTPWEQARAAAERTTRWAARCLAAHGAPAQLLFGIVQGGSYTELRERSAREISALGFAGYGIGGLSVGEPKQLTGEMLAATTRRLPSHAPRYLMGVGSPEDLLDFVDYGIDMFDSVLPTRLGRHGVVFTWDGPLNLRKSRHARSDAPIEAECACYTCGHHSRAYLHHLYKASEPLFSRLASLHNVALLLRLAEEIRTAIASGSFPLRRAQWLARLKSADGSGERRAST